MKKGISNRQLIFTVLAVFVLSFALCACDDDEGKKADEGDSSLDINIQSEASASDAGGDYSGVITFVDPTPTPEPEEAPAAEANDEEEVVRGALDGLVTVTADNVNIRSVPEATGAANVVAKATQGDMFECYEADPNWVKINYLGNEAYIAREFVIVEGNRNAIPGANVVALPEEDGTEEGAEQAQE